MRQIKGADKRNHDNIEESKRNMELQVTALSDGIATLQDMFSKLAENQLADKQLRETELATNENRFTAKHTHN